MYQYEAMSRGELKKLLAKEKITRSRLDEIDQRLRDIDGDLDAAVTQHQRDTAPVQAELAHIDEASLTSIMERRPLDEKQEQRRKNLLFQVEQANTTLEAARDEVERRLKVVRERAKVVEELPNRDVVQAWLQRTAAPEKIARHESLLWFRQLLENARTSTDKTVAAMASDTERAKQGKLAESYEVMAAWLSRAEAKANLVGEISVQVANEAAQLRDEMIED